MHQPGEHESVGQPDRLAVLQLVAAAACIGP